MRAPSRRGTRAGRRLNAAETAEFAGGRVGQDRLGGAQFSTGAVVDRLRSFQRDEDGGADAAADGTPDDAAPDAD